MTASQEDLDLFDSYILLRCSTEYAAWKATRLEQLRTEFMLATWNEEAFEEFCQKEWQQHEQAKLELASCYEDWADPIQLRGTDDEL